MAAATTHVIIEPELAATSGTNQAAAAEPGKPSPPNDDKKRPASMTAATDKTTKRRRRRRSHAAAAPAAVVHVSDVSSDEENDDDDDDASTLAGSSVHHGNHPAIASRSDSGPVPIPSQITAPTLTGAASASTIGIGIGGRPLRRIPTFPTASPPPPKDAGGGGSGVFYDGAELPFAWGNHPLMSEEVEGAGGGSGGGGGAGAVRAPPCCRSSAAPFLPLLPCPRLPTRRPPLGEPSSAPSLDGCDGGSSGDDDDKKEKELNGLRHVRTAEAHRRMQEEKTHRLRLYLERREKMKRRRNGTAGGEDHKREDGLGRMLLQASAVLVGRPDPAPSSSSSPPFSAAPRAAAAASSSNPSSDVVDERAKFSRCPPDVLDAALALTSCLASAPVLPREVQQQKGGGPQGPLVGRPTQEGSLQVVGLQSRSSSSSRASSSRSASSFKFNKSGGSPKSLKNKGGQHQQGLCYGGGVPLAAPSLCPLQ